MDSISYIMAGKQMATIQNLDTVSNNVANANSTGFKEDKLLFDQYLVSDVRGKTAYAGNKASISNMQAGALKTTYRTLDVAIDGPGFMLVSTPLGTRYTRSGNLHISNENRLVDGMGNPMLTSDGQEIVFEEGDNSFEIGEDGSVKVNGNLRANIGMVEFENTKLLRKAGNGLFQTDLTPLASEKSRMLQGVLEDSNVNSVNQVAHLINMNREAAVTSNLINSYYDQQRSTFRTLTKAGGSN